MTINKKLFFLSFLCITIATQCMETNDSEFTLNSPENRHELMSKLTVACPAITYPYYHENHSFALSDHYPKVKAYNGVDINGYSMLGFAAIAIKNYPSSGFKPGTTIYPEYAPYADRKKFIQALCKNGWKPTTKDRELD